MYLPKTWLAVDVWMHARQKVLNPCQARFRKMLNPGVEAQKVAVWMPNA